MGRFAAKRSISAVILMQLVAVLVVRAAADDAFVTAAADGFYALSRIEEAGLVPLTDDELAYITHPRTARKASPASSVGRRQLPDANSVPVEGGDETQPKTRGRSVVQEADPHAIVGYERKIMDLSKPGEAPATSPARRHEFPNTSGVSGPGDDPSALGFKAEKNTGIQIESGGEAPQPKTRGQSAAEEEEPDPRAVIDWLFRRSR
jgi:hypothetical protein